MNVQIGIKSDPVEYRYSYEWLFKLMERLGVHHLQLGSWFEMYSLPDRYFIRLRDQAADHRVRIHSCFSAHRELGGFVSPDPDVQTVTRSSYRRLIEIGVLVGAESVGASVGAIPRDRMDTKQEAIERCVPAMSEMAEYAGQAGLKAITIEPMSSLAEPPSTPDEITYFMEHLNADHQPAPIYFCSDVSHGLADESGSVVHSHMELFEYTIPWMWEFHLKNTDTRFESTFGFGPADLGRGIVDLGAIAELIGANKGRFPREEIVGYLEIPGPKFGRDYSDRLLGEQLTESIEAISEVFLLAE
ncbi:MAG: sugar phosphate isomerase/epimerase [Spirochaetaceae bacterium]|nr:sugar phosphate isomerase/epimerase [Spirochaetaceae bacterium]